MSLDSLFDQFLRERIYLRYVTSKTRDWYESAWRAFHASRSEPTQTERNSGDKSDLIEICLVFRSGSFRRH